MPLLGTRAAGAAKGFGITSGQPKPYAASYLVIAGGGGGSGGSSFMLGGGGGGAGGYRNSYASETSGGGGSTETPLQLTPNRTYTITVGGGGAGATGQGSGQVIGGAPGDDSSIAGTGITTVTSAGGGMGGITSAGADSGAAGGSGGGARNQEVAQEELELLIKVLLEDLLQEVVLADKLEAAEEPLKQEIQMVNHMVEMVLLQQSQVLLSQELAAAEVVHQPVRDPEAVAAVELVIQILQAILEQQILVAVAVEPALILEFHLEAQVKTEVMVDKV